MLLSFWRSLPPWEFHHSFPTPFTPPSPFRVLQCSHSCSSQGGFGWLFPLETVTSLLNQLEKGGSLHSSTDSIPLFLRIAVLAPGHTQALLVWEAKLGVWYCKCTENRLLFQLPVLHILPTLLSSSFQTPVSRCYWHSYSSSADFRLTEAIRFLQELIFFKMLPCTFVPIPTFNRCPCLLSCQIGKIRAYTAHLIS